MISPVGKGASGGGASGGGEHGGGGGGGERGGSCGAGLRGGGGGDGGNGGKGGGPNGEGEVGGAGAVDVALDELSNSISTTTLTRLAIGRLGPCPTHGGQGPLHRALLQTRAAAKLR